MGKYDPNFNGDIQLDVRQSTEDWKPYLAPVAKEGSPNILFILFDDTGLGAWEPFGGEIAMPTLKKIADRGLRYTQWHTAALCSPTRGMLLTGRNHHLNGNASITEGANGFPGQHARTSDQCATIAQILQDGGYSTFWVGKNHNVPETDVATGSTKKQWPLAKGFDRFYGFIGGETSQWFPDLTVDNHSIELSEEHFPGFTEEDEDKGGYHLSKDLADKAIQMIKDQQATNPSKPWYMWFCPGANHAPHQAPKSAIMNYKDKFLDGYDAYRTRVLDGMIAKGILPEGTQVTDYNPLEQYAEGIANPDDEVIPWSSLSVEAQELYSKMMQVYAGFSQYTDEQIGRIVTHLELTGQINNTVIIYAADNGASGEGSPTGSVNENKFFNGYPDTLADTLKYVTDIGGLDELGGPDTYEHFPTGWAAATSTPFKMFKRYSQYAGGTCDPLVISWLNGITDHGGIRHQYHHATDIVPTILDICGLKMPPDYKGVTQHPVSGVSMKYTFDAAKADAPTEKKHQYYAMLGTRAIWQDGWKAVAVHAPLSGYSKFDEDAWELYHVDTDRSESKNVAADSQANRDKLEALKALWFAEAEANWVLPLDDRSATEQLGVERPTEEPTRPSYRYFPGTAPVPEAVAVNIRGCSYTIEAEVDITPESKGVIFAHGSRFGGHTLFIGKEDHKLHYVYNFLGMEQQKVSSAVLAAGTYQFRVQFQKISVGSYGESLGKVYLYVNGGTTPVAQRDMRAQVGKFTLSGDGLCVGYDSADAIAADYSGSNPFHGGTIRWVEITPGDDRTPPSARVLAGAYSAD